MNTFPPRELEASKRAIAASFALSLEQPAAPLNFAIVSKRYGLPAGYWDAYPAKIMAISAADVRRVARKYLNPETHATGGRGRWHKIKAGLEKYGPVEVYDDDRRVPSLDQQAGVAGSTFKVQGSMLRPEIFRLRPKP